MSDMKRIEVEAEVFLDSWDNEELVEYLEEQGYSITKTPTDDYRLHKLADAKKYHPETFDRMFADYIYDTIGRIL